MTSAMKTILIFGATSGIGEAFARRFHSMGKKVIATGRREDRLAQLKNSLPGLETYTMDNTDISSLEINANKIFQDHPDIDTVWVNSGIQQTMDFKDPSTSSDAKIIQEITVNVTAPFILARHIVPKLVAQKKETTFMITSSGLAFTPVLSYPVYCPTKAAVHSFLVALRQSLKNTDVNVIAITPPYVETELDLKHKQVAGATKPMKLDDFTNEMFKVLEENKAKDLKEVGAGSALPRIQAWRSSIGAILEQYGIGG